MKKEYGEFSIEWRRVPGRIRVEYQVYNDRDGECEAASELMTLFEFLSSLGVTKNQCISAFDDEDSDE